MVEGECHECGNDYKDLRQHWAMSDCDEDPSQSAKVTIECANCGKDHTEWRYRVEKNDGSFCSHECRDEGQRNGKVLDCDWCGESTYVHNCHLSNEHHFCGLECEGNWRSERMSGETSPFWKGGPATLSCDECGEEYTVKKCEVGNSRFCSLKCKRDNWSDEPITKPCDWCQEQITRQPRNFKGDHAFCSNKCFSSWLSEQRRGSNNPAWSGGCRNIVTAVRRLIGSQSWDKTAREVRKRDGHICQKCHKFQPHRSLSCHHIIPLLSGGNNGKWNIMALCESCHGEVESFIKKYTEPHLVKYASNNGGDD